MSWRVDLIGHPENVIKALNDQSTKLTNQCKLEFDDAKDHLIGLVSQNFSKEPGVTPCVIKLNASGSGWAKGGEQVQRSVSVSMEVNYHELV
jgi:hypothetical protein